MELQAITRDSDTININLTKQRIIDTDKKIEEISNLLIPSNLIAYYVNKNYEDKNLRLLITNREGILSHNKQVLGETKKELTKTLEGYSLEQFKLKRRVIT